MRVKAEAFIAIVALTTQGALRAQDDNESQSRDWPRFHVGVALGPARANDSRLHIAEAGPIPAQIGMDSTVDASSNTGRKLVVGFLPARVVGVEMQYLDFGDAAATSSRVGGRVPFQLIEMEGSSDARVAAALLFLPERAPSADVYAEDAVTLLSVGIAAEF